MNEAAFKQYTFSALNMFLDPIKRSEGDYIYLSNGRSRFNIIRPIKKSKLFTTKFNNIQGISYLGNYLIIIADGEVYFKDITIDSEQLYKITRDSDITIDKNSTLWLCQVPSSTINYTRKIDENGNVIFDKYSSPSEMGIIVQDGVNQPLIITPNFHIRKINNYNQWTQDNREYVPIGRQMIFSNGILYIVSPDKKRIYHSVSGRPLDFMVVIDSDGNKLSDEKSGNADAVSFQVDLDDVTNISNINNNYGGFFLSTARTSYIVIPNTSIILFGEPTYGFKKLFDVGCINYKSIIDILGDTVFIETNGIRSFNAIFNSTQAGNNSIFSRSIARLLDGIIQSDDIACVGVYEDYALFSLKTVNGNAIAVYDMLMQSFSSVDYLSIDGNIKYFLYHPYTQRLLFYTDTGYIYEYSSTNDTEYEQCEFTAGQFSTGEGRVTHKAIYFKLLVSGNEAGIIKYIVTVDGKDLKEHYAYVNPSIENNVILHIPDGIAGWRTAITIKWSFNMSLSAVEMIADVMAEQSAHSTKVRSYLNIATNVKVNNNREITTERNKVITLNGEGFNDVISIYIGNVKCGILDKTDNVIKFVVNNNVDNDDLLLLTDIGYIYVNRVKIK